MAADTKIEWATHTFNPWRGCAHAPLSDGSEHPGCAHCYAETMSKRNPATLGRWGENGTRVVAAEKQWQAVERWNERAPSEGLMDRVFCASLADVFEDWKGSMVDSDGRQLLRCKCGDIGVVDHYDGFCEKGHNEHGDPLIGCLNCGWIDPSTAMLPARMSDFRGRVFNLIDRTPDLFWLLLTKRPGNVWRMWQSIAGQKLPHRPIVLHESPHPLFRPNVALLTSISDQATADELIPQLLRLRDLVPVLGLSVEPLLAPVDLPLDGISWVIVGGESGPHARPCNVAWIRDIVAQCREANVPVFVKQLGSRPVDLGTHFDWTEGVSFVRDPDHGNGARVLLEDKKGGDWNEWPEDLRVREFPAAFYRQEVQA